MTNALEWDSPLAIANLRVFCHKLEVEFLQTSQHFDNHVFLWQDGRPEVVSAGRLPSLLGRGEGLLGELDLRECVHRSLYSVARNSGNTIEGVGHELCPLGVAGQG